MRMDKQVNLNSLLWFYIPRSYVSGDKLDAFVICRHNFILKCSKDELNLSILES